MEELLSLVKTNWTFDEENYSRLQSDQKEDRVMNYAVNHILKHEAKTLGLLATFCEESDHTGKPIDREQLVIITRRMLIHTLSLAGLLGLSSEDLSKEIRSWAEKVHRGS
jgi:hypothetical protein